MKTMIFILTLGLSATASAQMVGVPVDSSQGATTIDIRKGRANQVRYEVHEQEEEITGDPANIKKDARANWKAECTDWKKQMREMNKEQIVLSLNCGSPKCERTDAEVTCTSKGKSKVRVKITE